MDRTAASASVPEASAEGAKAPVDAPLGLEERVALAIADNEDVVLINIETDEVTVTATNRKQARAVLDALGLGDEDDEVRRAVDA